MIHQRRGEQLRRFYRVLLLEVLIPIDDRLLLILWLRRVGEAFMGRVTMGRVKSWLGPNRNRNRIASRLRFGRTSSAARPRPVADRPWKSLNLMTLWNQTRRPGV